MEASCLGPQCCSTRGASWAGLPQVKVLCEYRAGGLSCQNHCSVQPGECLWHGNLPTTLWNCFLWLEGGLQLSGHGLASQYCFQAWRSPLSHDLFVFLLVPASSLGSPGSWSAALWSQVTGHSLSGWWWMSGWLHYLCTQCLNTSQVPYSHLFLPCQVHTCAKSLPSTLHQWLWVWLDISSCFIDTET